MKLLINNGRRRLGITGRPAIILSPGDSVPLSPAQIDEIRRNRTVCKWLGSGVLQLIDSKDVVEKAHSPVVTPSRPRPHMKMRLKRGDVREKLVLPKGVTGEGVETHHKGGGWYEVYVNGFKVTDSNVRKDEATEIAAEYE